MNEERARFKLSVGLLLASAVAVGVDLPPEVRAPVMLLFLIWVPGSAVWDLSAIRDPVQYVVLSVTTSAMLASLVSLLVLYAGLWSAAGIYAIIAGITGVLLLIRAIRLWPLAIPILLDMVLMRISRTYRTNVELARWSQSTSKYVAPR